MEQTSPGTLTFFFCDLEGSTSLLHRIGPRYADLLLDLRRLLRAAIEHHLGREVDTAGDGLFAVFPSARDALAAAADVQRAIDEHRWPDGAAVRLRIGLHTGEPSVADGSYVGLAVHRAARICSAAHGGQVLLSRATADLVRHALPQGVSGVRELGLHRLKDLPEPEPLVQADIAGLGTAFPPLRTRTERLVQLPAQLTSFVGREREVERVRALLGRGRLVTLTGPGGTGKTRLSLETAAAIAKENTEAFADGVVFVPLGSTTDPSLVPTAVAQALDLHEKPDRAVSETVIEHLRERSLLLLIDNFEQVLAAAPFVAELLAACPALTVLATSRAPLHLRGEQEFPVPPLALPALPDTGAAATLEVLAGQEAVALFVERARAVRPDFALTAEVAPSVVEICRRLDGLPLAIELAAARVKLFSPAAIQVRLGRLFQLLSGGAQDRPARHQTLRQAIAWSYDLLSEEEQAFFRRMAVFRGGCTLDAATEVCIACQNLKQACIGCGDLEVDPFEAVAMLVDQSLLRREEGPGGEPRFVMLETIREYGLECLEKEDELDLVRQAHAEYFLALVEQAKPRLTGPEQRAWMDRLQADHDNLRAVLTWVEEQRAAEVGWRLGAGLWRFWVSRNHMAEGRERLERLLALPGEASRAHAEALNGMATIVHEMGDFATSRQYLEESLAIWRALGDEKGMATALNGLGWVTICQNDYARGQALSEEALALCRSVDDKRGASVALMNLGWVSHLMGDLKAARANLEQCMVLRRDVGDHRGYAFVQSILSDLARQRGEYERATALIEEALPTLLQLDDTQLIANALYYQGWIANDLGDYERAEALMEESLALWKSVGNRVGFAETQMELAMVLCEQGRIERARALLEEALHIWRSIGLEWGIARSLLGLVYVALNADALEQASERMHECLALYRKCRDRRGLLEGLEALGHWYAARGETPEMVRLWASAAAFREETGYAAPRRLRDTYARRLEEARAELGEAGFERTWAEGRALSLEQAVEALPARS